MPLNFHILELKGGRGEKFFVMFSNSRSKFLLIILRDHRNMRQENEKNAARFEKNAN